MTEKIRAKFVVNSIERHAHTRRVPDGTYVPSEAQTVKMTPVYGHGDPAHENSKFWAATPAGQIALTMVNAEAVKAFDIGKEFYVDFTPAG